MHEHDTIMSFSARVGRVCGAFAAILAVTILTAACRPDLENVKAPASRRVTPNILFIVVDTLRADRLGCYGYRQPTSPFMDDLARSGTRYTRVSAVAPWTLPSHASMFTGLYPLEHGVHRHPKAADAPGKSRTFLAALSPKSPTLASVLRDLGYQTGGFAANAGYLDPRFKLDHGFDAFEIPVPFGPQEVWRKPPAGRINHALLQWLKARDRDKPFFAFVNYMDVHIPYRCEPHVDLPKAQSEPVQHKQLEQVLQHSAAVESDATELSKDDLLETLSRQYDIAIRHVDDDIAALFGELERMGLRENLMVVITSDHGEYLGEHEFAGHEGGLHESVLHVPLIMSGTAVESGRLAEDRLSNADIIKLIAMRIPPMAEYCTSHDFYNASRPIAASDDYPRVTPHLAERTPAQPTVFHAIYIEPFKLITDGGERAWLYNLAVDPGELNDLAATDIATVARLRASLNEYRTKAAVCNDVQQAAPADPNRRRNMRDIGYLQDD